jgi:hypothetical protein
MDTRATRGTKPNHARHMESAKELGAAIRATSMRAQPSTMIWPNTPLVVSGSTLLNGNVGYWKLDEGSGATRNDSTANANHLTDHNTVGSSAGKIGNAADFVAASSRYLTAADAAAFQMGTGTDFSYAAWIKFTDTTSGQYFLAYGTATAGYSFRKSATLGKLVVLLGANSTNNTFASNTAWNDGNWHLVIVTVVRSGSMTIYVDNNADGNVSVAALNGFSVNSAVGFQLGALNAGSFLSGSLDEVGLWNRIIDATERSALWNGGAGLTHPF